MVTQQWGTVPGGTQSAVLLPLSGRMISYYTHTCTHTHTHTLSNISQGQKIELKCSRAKTFDGRAKTDKHA